MSQATFPSSHPRPASAVRFKSRDARRMKDKAFVAVCIVAAAMSLVVLAVLLTSILVQGIGHLDWQFIRGIPSRDADQAGIWPPIIGTLITCLVCALTAIPIGIATAILLEEYKPKNRYLAKAHAFIQLNITNLAGVPSVVYGILGLTVFVQAFNLDFVGTQLDPGFEFGVQWYDRFLLEDGTALRVPVNSRGAEATEVSADLPFETEDGAALPQVRIVPRDELAPLLDAVSERMDAFEEALEPVLEAGVETPTPEALAAAVDHAWATAGLKSDPAAVKPGFVAALSELRGLEGRELRRARSRAMRIVEEAENRAQMPGVLAADAVPSRVADMKPWYFRLPLGRGVLAGGLTLMLVILPIIIISSQEALRAVPRSLRQGSLALGATQWQTIWKMTLPSAIPGIMTGTILAMSRAIGEAAPMLIIAGIVYVTFTPQHLMDDFTVMPLQIFQWASRPQKEFHDIAAAGIIILLAILLLFNGIAIYIRQKTQRQM